MAFPGLADRVAEVRARIAAAAARGGHGQQVTIVAVTKTHGPDAARAAYESGLHDVGENKVQEALKKIGRVAVPVRWHLIGHLQRNKVKSLEHFDAALARQPSPGRRGVRVRNRARSRSRR